MPSDMTVGTNLAVGDFVIDRADERVLGPEGPLKIGNKAYRVLLSLAEQDGKLLTKDALFSTVWDGTIVSRSALTSVRRALGDRSRTPRYIESVYGRGYRLLAPVRPIDGTGDRAPARQRPRPEVARAGRRRRPAAGGAGLRLRRGGPRPFPWSAAELREEVLSGLSRSARSS